MIESIKFVNHINEVIEFGENGIYANYNDLRDYAWEHSTTNNKITAFNRGIVNKTIPITIKCNSEKEGLAIKNKLHEIAEKDVLAMKHGKIIVGDYYLKCFVTGSKKENYLIDKQYLEVSLDITTDFPQWIKETVTSFRPHKENEFYSGKRNLDYNFDFPFDYASEMKNKRLINTGFVGTPFKIIIYGACKNPAIHIAGHTYQVDCEISEKEYLTIDALSKKITLTRYNGKEVNCFNGRNRQSYIFEKIPAGENIVTWNNEFSFDVVLFEERSEPKWI